MRIVSAVVCGLLMSLPVGAPSQETGEEYEKLVDEILEVTGALKVGEQLGAVVIEQMFGALKASNSNVSDEIYEIIQEEVNAVLSESMASRSFQELMYPVYAKHLTKSDLEAMMAFYRTPEGQRIAAALPLMAQEGMLAGQAWGASLGPQIGRRVVQRLSDEGFELP